MDKAKLYDGARGNPILVLRTLSALVNFLKIFSFFMNYDSNKSRKN